MNAETWLHKNKFHVMFFRENRNKLMSEISGIVRELLWLSGVCFIHSMSALLIKLLFTLIRVAHSTNICMTKLCIFKAQMIHFHR